MPPSRATNPYEHTTSHRTKFLTYLRRFRISYRRLYSLSFTADFHDFISTSRGGAWILALYDILWFLDPEDFFFAFRLLREVGHDEIQQQLCPGGVYYDCQGRRLRRNSV